MRCQTVVTFTGIHCEINVDDCNPSTDPITKEPKCFNGGECVDGVGGYHCICPAGYVGERCEGDVNECLSNPCDPRGTHNCVQLTNNYRCECRTGYTGTGHSLVATLTLDPRGGSRTYRIVVLRVTYLLAE